MQALNWIKEKLNKAGNYFRGLWQSFKVWIKPKNKDNSPAQHDSGSDKEREKEEHQVKDVRKDEVKGTDLAASKVKKTIHLLNHCMKVRFHA